MGGKASLLMILGFSMIFLVVARNFGSVSTSAVTNYAYYFERSEAHNIAISAANMAANEIFLDNTWMTGFNNITIGSGTANVSVASINDQKVITSVGNFRNETHTIVLKLSPSSFAKFAWYAGNMSSKVFISGDTVWGPFHSQSQMNIGGSPVFYGKATNFKGFSPDPKQWASNGYDPKFYGGVQTGVDIPLPANYQFTTQKAAAIDGVTNKGGSSYFENTDVYLTFKPNGKVRVRVGTGADSNSYGPGTTYDVDDFAPNKIIYLKRGNIYVSGVISGELSIVSGESSGLGNGNVYVTNDLVYANDPITYLGNNKYGPTNSPDMLGLMSTNNIFIADTPQNKTNVRIDASIFCAQGGFKAENLNTLTDQGTLFIRGGVIAAKEEEVAQVSGSSIKGYRKHVIFDERNRVKMGPPLFPKTGTFEIVSWFE